MLCSLKKLLKWFKAKVFWEDFGEDRGFWGVLINVRNSCEVWEMLGSLGSVGNIWGSLCEVWEILGILGSFGKL